MREIHLFIVCMNNSGSTLLQNILGGCQNAVTLVNEGQLVPGVDRFMPLPGPLGAGRVFTEIDAVFTNELNYDWPMIRKLWREDWSKNPKYASANPRILVEKSPPNVVRAAMLQKEFPGATFLLMVRNPYAVCEGIRRRRDVDLRRCVSHWIKATRRQVENLAILRHREWFTYEELCEKPAVVRSRIVKLVPELQDLSLEGTHFVHSLLPTYANSVQNLNDRQMARLTPAEVDLLSSMLADHVDLLHRFGYRLLTADRVVGRGPQAAEAA